MSSYQAPNQGPRSSVYQVEINRLLMEVERLKKAEQGMNLDHRPTSISVPTGPPKDFALQEQPSSRVSKNSAKRVISIVVGIALIIGLATGIVSLVKKMQTSGVSFSQGNNNAGSQTVYAAELESHNSASDCWVVYHGNVYDVTSYANRHPAGASWITNSCGMDGTSKYTRYHAESLLRSIQGQMIGSFSESTSVVAEETNGSNADSTASPHDDKDSSDESEDEDDDYEATDDTVVYTPDCGGSTCISVQELATHKSADDCWVALHGVVYDLTDYAKQHPGGSSVVTVLAGTDGTDEYDRFHKTRLLSQIEDDIVGYLSASDVTVSVSVSRAKRRKRDSDDSEDSDEDESEDEDEHGNHRRPTSSPVASPTAPPTGGTLSGITMVEVARHNTRSDCWVVFYDDVYDLSTYFHPGSTDLCGSGRAGTDQTSAFAATGAVPTHNQALLNQYVSSLWKGTVVTQDNLKSTPSPTDAPTGAPTGAPTATAKTPAPTVSTTPAPTTSAVTSPPTSSPTARVTPAPTVTDATPAPTTTSTPAPTASPTASPTAAPTAAPTASPTAAPTASPTRSPTASPTGPTIATISLTEMKSHSSNNDCWVAIDGTVYDVSKYSHPGGNFKKCGNDITSKYYSVNSPPHTKSLLAVIASYDIGILG